MKKVAFVIVFFLAFLFIWASHVQAGPPGPAPLTFTPPSPQIEDTVVGLNCRNADSQYYVFDNSGNLYGSNFSCATPFAFNNPGSFTVVEWKSNCSTFSGTTLGEARADGFCYIQEASYSITARTAYYFNNAVNTNPGQLGNYWNNAGLTSHASQLPNFNVDKVTVVAGAIFAGNAIFNGDAANHGTVDGMATFNHISSNDGTVTGDATFVGNFSENTGIVQRAMIRDYNSEVLLNSAFSLPGYPNRDFVTRGPWTIKADGVSVRLFGSAIDGNSTLVRLNGGKLISRYVFTNDTDQSPGTLGNYYWYDYLEPDYPDGMQSALQLPDFSDDEITIVPGAIFNGDYVANGDAINNGVVTNTGTFHDHSQNDGEVTGDATFRDYAQNAGDSATVDGNAFFYDHAINSGAIRQDATFYNDGPENLGVKGGATSGVTGVETRYYTVDSIAIQDFTSVGPWTVVADAAVVDVSSSTYDNTTTFTPLNGGSFVGIVGATYYFNNASSTSPNDQGNYWNDSGYSDPATHLPDFATDQINIAEFAIFDGNYIGNGSAINSGEVTGNAVFNGSSNNGDGSFYNGGAVDGNATFNDNSVNSGLVGGTGTFHDNADNNGNGFNFGATVELDGFFYDNSTNHSDVDGNAYFFDSSVESGHVHNNAIFNGDLSEILHHGNARIDGIQERRYSSDIETTRDFTQEGNWTVLADGAVVNVTRATFNNNTVFTTANNGSFIFPLPVLSSASIHAKTLTLTYDRLLNTTSIPAPSDYAVTINGIPLNPTSVTIMSSQVILNLALSENISTNDSVLLSYTPGLNSVQSQQGATATALNGTTVGILTTVSVGDNPSNSVAVGTKLYVINNGAGTVSVINTNTDAVVATVTVGTNPQSLAVSGTKVYVPNFNSNSVSVINTLTDTRITNINVGAGPLSAIAVGTKIYVTNVNAGTVSVINTSTDTVIATISVGSNPRYSSLVGTKLYVNNASSSSVSVINTLTNTVTATITVGSNPQNSSVLGTKLYVNANSNVSVINTLTDTVSSTIAVGSTAKMSCVVGTKLYVMKLNNFVSVINSATDTVLTTIQVGNAPFSCLAIGTNVYALNAFGAPSNTSNSVSVIDSNTDLVTDTIAVGTAPGGSSAAGTKLYVLNNGDNTVSVIDTSSIVSQLPKLVSFSSNTPSGGYSVGQTITITANFDRLLLAGSTMTVSLNSGASIVLNNLNVNTLSGIYTIASGELTPDLSVSAITSASVSDIAGHTRTSYTIPSSVGNFSAENPLIMRNLGDASNIVIGSYKNITTDSNPAQISEPISIRNVYYFYVTNQGSNSVSVIRQNDNSAIAVISVGHEPYGIKEVSIRGVTYLYIANTADNTVSVINSQTNAVIATISVGVKPYSIDTVGTTIYVTNGQSNSVSVIDGLTNTVTTTIPVGLNPRGIKAQGTDIYVANFGDQNLSGGNSISVINSLTNTVTNTIILPAGTAGPFALTSNNGNIYVANYLSSDISVIDATSKTIIATTSVGAGSRNIISTDNGIYVTSFNSGTIWKLSPTSYAVTAITTTGNSPAGLSSSGNDLYILNFKDNGISVLNTLTNTLRDTSLTNTNSGNSGGGGGGSTSSIPTVNPTTPQIPNPANPETPGQIITPPETNHGPIDKKLSNRLKGNLLLDVEDHGKIWYLDPISLQRFKVTIDNALDIFRRLSLGISNVDLQRSSVLNRLKGRLLLQVSNHGLVWYVDMKGKAHAVTISTVLDIFRKLSLGINADNLDKIKIGTF